jgi:hypothetical protein
MILLAELVRIVDRENKDLSNKNWRGHDCRKRFHSSALL